jgi:hypothetical protein
VPWRRPARRLPLQRHDTAQEIHAATLSGLPTPRPASAAAPGGPHERGDADERGPAFSRPSFRAGERRSPERVAPSIFKYLTRNFAGRGLAIPVGRDADILRDGGPTDVSYPLCAIRGRAACAGAWTRFSTGPDDRRGRGRDHRFRPGHRGSDRPDRARLGEVPRSVFTHDRISTAEKSIVRVLLGGKAVVTARELSVLTIHSRARASSLPP